MNSKCYLVAAVAFLVSACQGVFSKGEYFKMQYEQTLLELFRGSVPHSVSEAGFNLQTFDVLLIDDKRFVASLDDIVYSSSTHHGKLTKKGVYTWWVKKERSEPHYNEVAPWEFPVNTVSEMRYSAAAPYAHYRLVSDDPDPVKCRYELIRSRGKSYKKVPDFRVNDVLPELFANRVGLIH